MERVKFIVVEPSYLIRKGIVSIINRIEHSIVIKETDSLESINKYIDNDKPDFLVLNYELFNKFCQTRNNKIRIDLTVKGITIVTSLISNHIEESVFREVIYLNDTKEEIFEKINGIVTTEYKGKSTLTLNDLTEREKTILKNVAKGLTNKEIADKLFLSTHTVITHRKNITSKLGIKTISGLTIYAILNNIISLYELKS